MLVVGGVEVEILDNMTSQVSSMGKCGKDSKKMSKII